MNSNDQTFASIGMLVVLTQSIEALLDVLLTFVCQDGTPLTSDRIMHLEKTHRKKTLGYFIRKMKERVSFEEHMDDALERFLENRNKLIHRFSEIDGHELVSATDKHSVDSFIAQLYRDAMTVMCFCAALLHAWQLETGLGGSSIDEHKTPEMENWIKGIKTMAQHIETLVFAKEN